MSHYNLFMNNKHQGFFNLTEKEQEKLKKENAQWAMDYQIFLYRNICSLKNMNFDDMEEAFIPFDVEYKFNIQKLRYFGVGEKRFQIITPLADGEQTEDYKTLYDYDKSIYEQGAKLIKEQTDETPAEYTPQLLDVFARAEIGENKDFRYLFLRTASNKIIAALEDFYIEKFKNKIPHEYIEVSRAIDNDDDFDFNIINYKLEANGDEHILLELKERIDLYIGEINLKYQAYFKDNNIDIIWTEEIEDQYGDEIFLFFSNEKTIKDFELRHWQESFEQYRQDDLSTLHRIIDAEKIELSQFIESNLNNIKENQSDELREKHKLTITVAVSNDTLDMLEEVKEDKKKNTTEDNFESKKSKFTVIKNDD